MIRIDNISKHYGNVVALKNISLTIEDNEIFGLIGPDGAGKTSLFRILLTLLLPDEGNISVFDYDIIKDYKKIRNIVGYMPGKFSLYEDLSIEENINFFASVFGTTLKENYHMVKDIYQQIEPFKKRKAGQLSGGMKQKLALSCALIHKPKLLVLDEPTTGVDAVSRKEFWEMLKTLKSKGITVVVATPYMDEANMCDRIALIQKGKLLKIQTPENLINDFKKKLISIRTNNLYKLMNDMKDFEKASDINLFGQSIHYIQNDSKPDVNEIRLYLQNKNHQEIKIEEIQPNVEDCFIELMRSVNDQ